MTMAASLKDKHRQPLVFLRICMNSNEKSSGKRHVYVFTTLNNFTKVATLVTPGGFIFMFNF